MIRHESAGIVPRSRASFAALASLLVALAVVACSGTGTTPSGTRGASPIRSIGAKATPSPSQTPAPSASATASSRFTPTGPMTVARSRHTATLLSDGRVLIAGGVAPNGDQLSSAELFDPRTGKFSPTGSMTTQRDSQTATLLQDGRVLITGGYDAANFPGTGIAVPGQATPSGPWIRRSAELYDPKTGTFTATGSMSAGRMDYTATLLHDGRVLIAGGSDWEEPGAFATGELYDPRTGKFSDSFDIDFSVATLIQKLGLLPDRTIEGVENGGEEGQ